MKIRNILAAAAVALFLQYQPLTAHAASETLDHVVAVVDDDVIMASEVDTRTHLISRQIAQSGSQMPPEELLRKQVLERLIVESLQLQMGNRAGIKVTDEQLQQAIDGIAAQNRFSTEQLKQQLQHDDIPFNVFRENIRREIIMQQVQQALVSKRVEVSDQDVENFLKSDEGKLRNAPVYHLAHIILDALNESEYSAQQAKATVLRKQLDQGADFRELAARNSSTPDAAQGGDLGWRQSTQLPQLYADALSVLKAGQVSAPLRSEKGIHLLKLIEVKSPFDQVITQTHARHILIKTSAVRSDEEAHAMLQKIRQKIVRGGDFSALAKQYSNDPGSALKGGDLGWASPGQMVPEFEQTADNTPVLQVSEPFRTQFGWHILQVLERRQQNVSDEMLRQQVRNFLRKRRYDDELPRWLKEIRDNAYVQIKE